MLCRICADACHIGAGTALADDSEKDVPSEQSGQGPSAKQLQAVLPALRKVQPLKLLRANCGALIAAFVLQVLRRGMAERR